MIEDKIRAQAAGVFLRAAAYIRRYGWQEKGMNVDGQARCSMGALHSAQTGKWDGQLADVMYNSLQTELNGMSLTQYNHKHQNGEKVAQLYERVAAKLSPRTMRGV